MTRKKTARPKRDTVDDAETAGIQYATDQLESEYFINWVGDQIYEASQMPPEKVHPLETKADAKKIARNMLQQLEWDTKRDLGNMRSSGELERLTGINTLQATDAFYVGLHRGLSNPSTLDWLAEEILEMNRGARGERVEEALRPRRSAPDTGPTSLTIDGGLEARRLTVGGPSKTLRAITETWVVHQQGNPGDSVLQVDIFKPRGQLWTAWTGNFTRAREREIANRVAAARNGTGVPAGAREPGVVRDYIAVDRNDRRVSGPFKTRGEAEPHVPPGGYVKFTSKDYNVSFKRPPAPSSYPMFRAKEAGGRARRPKARRAR